MPNFCDRFSLFDKMKNLWFHNQLTSEIDSIGAHVSYEVMELLETIKLKQIDFVEIVNHNLGNSCHTAVRKISKIPPYFIRHVDLIKFGSKLMRSASIRFEDSKMKFNSWSSGVWWTCCWFDQLTTISWRFCAFWRWIKTFKNVWNKTKTKITSIST